MTGFWKIVGAGIAAVLVFDTIASFASARVGFPYVYASVGSFLIYAAVGYAAFRLSGVGASVGAAVIVELVDATLGWWVSWQIGPGAIPEGQLRVQGIVVTVLGVLVFAVVAALLGAWAARLLHGRRQLSNA